MPALQRRPTWTRPGAERRTRSSIVPPKPPPTWRRSTRMGGSARELGAAQHRDLVLTVSSTPNADSLPPHISEALEDPRPACLSSALLNTRSRRVPT